jgi:hypothetical protein
VAGQGVLCRVFLSNIGHFAGLWQVERSNVGK